MRLKNFLLTAMFAATGLLFGAAKAQSITIESGHSVLSLPAGMQAFSAPLARHFTGGDPIRIDRQVLLLSVETRRPRQRC